MALPGHFTRRGRIAVGVALALTLASARRVDAQSETGRLEGNVASKEAAVAPTGAVVEATRLVSDSISTDRAPVDDHGHYRFDALRPGDYAVRLTAPLLDSLALSLPERAATIVAGTVLRVDFALPSGQAIREAVCPGLSLGRGRGVVAGHAIDADTEEPLLGARVVVLWRELGVDDSTLQVAKAEHAGEATVGPGGEYRLCGVPTDTRLEVQLQHRGRASADVALTVPDSVGAVAMELSLSPTATLDSADVAAPTGPQPTTPSGAAAGTATVGGIVRGALGQPLASTEVRARGVEGSAVTDSTGRFSLSSLPAGTQVLVLRHIGYEPVELPVELRAGRITRRDVRLTRAISLDSVRVVALRSQYPEFDYNRRLNPFGRFLTPDEVARRKPTEPTDLLFGITGLSVVGHGPTAAVVSTRHIGCKGGVNVIVDGMEHVEPNAISASDVAAVEIYSDGTFAPSRFAIRGSCGVVVIWTKASRRIPRPSKPAG